MRQHESILIVGAHNALLAPFDPLIWERDRMERLVGMRYRIEIYVPAEQRAQQLLGWRGRAALARTEPAEARAQLLQAVPHQLPYSPQRMPRRNAALRGNVGE